MPEGFHSATSYVEANPLFRLETSASWDGYNNVLGFFLSSWGDKPLSDEQLEKIGADAVKVAQNLLDEQVYSHVGSSERTYKLWGSIKSDSRGGAVNVYSDARSPIGYPYAGSIEYGFHPYGHSTFIPPRPFLRPALEFAVNATRASWETNVEHMVRVLANNDLSLSHFLAYSNDLGASRRNWGRNLQSHIDYNSMARMRGATTVGVNRGRYSHEVNQSRYGTEKGAYHRIWDVDTRR